MKSKVCGKQDLIWIQLVIDYFKKIFSERTFHHFYNKLSKKFYHVYLIPTMYVRFSKYTSVTFDIFLIFCKLNTCNMHVMKYVFLVLKIKTLCNLEVDFLTIMDFAFGYFSINLVRKI